MARVHIDPDLARAIVRNQNYRGFDGFARRNYGISGKKLLARLVAGEAGGKGVGRAGVSTAGARGPAQFISSTRAAYLKKYRLDPWRSNDEAIKAAIIHIKSTGLAGYNPGDPGYSGYILGQRTTGVSKAGGRAGGASTLTGVAGKPPRVQPGGKKIDYGAALVDTLLTNRGRPGGLMRAVEKAETDPAYTTVTPPKIVGGKTRKYKVPAAGPGDMTRTVKGKGRILEVFYDPLGEYYDNGKVVKGAIGGHDNHVHVAASPQLVIRLGKLAQKRGLTVRENPAFDPVDPVHTKGSFHYRKRAIDVSGDPAALRRFARDVIRMGR